MYCKSKVSKEIYGVFLYEGMWTFKVSKILQVPNDHKSKNHIFSVFDFVLKKQAASTVKDLPSGC